MPSPLNIDSLGGYHLERLLDKGGMGLVYEARSQDGQTVALKVVEQMGDSDVPERFRREMRALRALRHPNIVRFHEFGETERYLYLAMELIEGRPLSEILAERGPFAFEDVARIGLQLAEAVVEVHDKDLLHRDLKLSNVMLQPDGTAKLLDFGVSRPVDGASMTQSNQRVGTPQTMAPEYLAGGRPSPSMDLYGIGILLYTLLAGRPPFVGATMEVVERALKEPPPSLREARPNVPDWLEEIVLQCLAKQPAERQPSARHLAEQLRTRSAEVDGVTVPALDLRSKPAEPSKLSTHLPTSKEPHSRRGVWLGLVAFLVLVALGLSVLSTGTW